MAFVPFLAPAFPLLIETFGLADTEQLMSVAQIQQNDMAALSLRPFHLQIRSLENWMLHATTGVVLGDGALVACIAHLPNGIRVEYPTRIIREVINVQKCRATYDFKLCLPLDPVVMMSNGQPLPWRVGEIAELEQSMSAIQDGFAMIGRATAHGILTADEAADEVRKLTLVKPKMVELGPGKPRTRKIRVE